MNSAAGGLGGCTSPDADTIFTIPVRNFILCDSILTEGQGGDLTDLTITDIVQNLSLLSRKGTIALNLIIYSDDITE